MITNTSLDANRWDQKIECVKNWFSLIYEEIIHSAIKLFLLPITVLSIIMITN